MFARIGRPAKHPLSARAQARGLTLAQVAERVELSRAQLNNLLSGQTCPELVALRLAAVLHADVPDLGLRVAQPSNALAVMRWCRQVITTAHTRPIAQACGVSQDTVQRWRRPDHRGPTEAQIAVIAQVTGHPFTDPAAVCATCGQEMP